MPSATRVQRRKQGRRPDPTADVVWVPIARHLADELKNWSKPMRLKVELAEDGTAELFAQNVVLR